MDITTCFNSGLFKRKTIFVTGGGSGINLGIARNFAALEAAFARSKQELGPMHVLVAGAAGTGMAYMPYAFQAHVGAATESEPIPSYPDRSTGPRG